MMNKFYSVLRLTRIEHSIMLIIAVLAAELIAKGLPSPYTLVLSLMTPVFISMAAFAINDYFDIRVDRLNKKKRPLVTGDLKPRDAVYTTAVSLAMGVGASALINTYCLAIALVFGLLSILYSYRLKGVMLVGNAYIAFSMSIPFIFGSYVLTTTPGLNILLVSLMVFLSGLAREIHGTIRDLEGDVRARNLNTLPRIIGKRRSAAIAFLLYLIAILISAYLFLYVSPFLHNSIYLIIIGASDLMLLYTALGYLYKDEEEFYSLSRDLSLGAMALALLAFLISPL